MPDFPKMDDPPMHIFGLGSSKSGPQPQLRVARQKSAPPSVANPEARKASPRGPKKFVASEPRGTKERSEKGKKQPSPANPESQKYSLEGPKMFVASEPRGTKILLGRTEHDRRQ